MLAQGREGKQRVDGAYLIHDLLFGSGICKEALHEFTQVFGVLQFDPGLV
jgi:hypothetical protein